MSDFPMPEPSAVLQTKEELLEWCKKNESSKDRYRTRERVKSLWLIAIIDEVIKATKRDFAYNAEVKMIAAHRLGMGKLTHAEAATEGDALSWAIYYAQQYHHSDTLVAAGYVPCTQALIEEVGVGGQIQPHVVKLFDIVINGEKQRPEPETYTIREVGGKLYAMKPRKKKYALAVRGQPVKVVKQGKKAKATA